MTLVATGSDDNVVIIRKASQSEVTSIIMREQADIVSTFPEIKMGSDNKPLFTNELYVLINLLKRDGEGNSNVTVRGVTEKSMEMRPDIKLIEGRMYKPGTAEIIAGKSIAKRFKGCQIGEQVRFGSREWTVVGIFDAGGSAFDSEIWGDVDQMMDAFRRPVYSSMTMKLSDPANLSAVVARIEGDLRLQLEAKPEKEYYAAQSTATTQFYHDRWSGDLHHIQLRCNRWRDDHDVCRGCEPDERNRHAAIAGIQPAEYSGDFPV